MMVDMAENEHVQQNNQKYFILLIITDGIINDMQKTIDEIVRGSAYPLSIIIVGVGQEDFTSMETLDADDEPLYSKTYKKVMERDIVQFVPFRDFRENPVLLAKETLAEVPKQLISIFEKNKITPKAVKEEEKQQIKQKLSRVSTLVDGKSQAHGAPPFFMEIKDKFMDKCQEMGMDFMEVNDFLDEKGIAECNLELVIDYMKNPNYVNKLKRNLVKGSSNKVNYEYFDPS